MEKYTEKTLVFQPGQGDGAAVDPRHGRYRKALRGSIQLIVKDPDGADDLLQDTFVKVWQRFHPYDPAKSGLFNWLLTIARHTALDFVRRHKLVYVPLQTVADHLPGCSYCWQPSSILNIRQLVKQRLRSAQWQVIEVALAYWQGYTHGAIAGQLVLPLDTGKSRICLSLRQLRPVFDFTPRVSLDPFT